MWARHLLLLMLLLPLSAVAAPEMRWDVLPQDSTIHFTAINNGVSVKGWFERFDAAILLDPENTSQAHIKATVILDSVASDYDAVAMQLRSAEWFNVKDYPEAVFETTQVTSQGKNAYVADGVLTLHGMQKPVTLPFTFVAQGSGKVQTAIVKAHTTIRRTDFDIGQGAWAATNVVADAVQVDVTLKLRRNNGTP